MNSQTIAGSNSWFLRCGLLGADQLNCNEFFHLLSLVGEASLVFGVSAKIGVDLLQRTFFRLAAPGALTALYYQYPVLSVVAG